MKIEFETPTGWPDEMLVLCRTKEPTPVAFMNVYETGDVWVKKRGCESCPDEIKQKCCQGCAMLTPKGCLLHLTNTDNSDKPFRCVVNPSPKIVLSHCALEFECVAGKNKGKVRKIREPDLIREQ
jgi:hypothetical protein